MTSALQNRLVGTIIVVALVVIVLPEFLDGEKQTNKQEFVDIVPISKLVEVNSVEPFNTNEVESQVNQAIEIVEETAIDDPSNEQVTSTTSSPNNNVTDNVTQTATDTLQNISEMEDSLAQIDVKNSGYVVQLGSFRHEKNVKDLLKILSDAGYRAYSRPVITHVGKLTKVFVGPELEKRTLELALPHLQEITKTKGKITAFEVSAN